MKTMKKLVTPVPASQQGGRVVAPKRKVPTLSESRQKLFAGIETHPVFGQEAFLARYSFLKKNG